MQGCVKKRRQRILIGVLVVTTLSACGALAEDGPLSGSGKGEGFDKDNAPGNVEDMDEKDPHT